MAVFSNLIGKICQSLCCPTLSRTCGQRTIQAPFLSRYSAKPIHETYRNDRLVVVTATGQPLASLDDIGFADTLEYEFIGLYEGSVIDAFVHQAAGPPRKSVNSISISDV